MTQKQMFSIIPVLQKLVGIKLPLKNSYAIYRLAKEIDAQKDFFIEEEKKLVEKYNGLISPEGRITFEDVNSYEPFTKEYVELNELEVSLTETLPIKINLDSVESNELTPADFLALDGVIDFE